MPQDPPTISFYGESNISEIWCRGPFSDVDAIVQPSKTWYDCNEQTWLGVFKSMAMEPVKRNTRKKGQTKQKSQKDDYPLTSLTSVINLQYMKYTIKHYNKK